MFEFYNSSYSFSYTGNYSNYSGYAKYLPIVKRNICDFIKSQKGGEGIYT